jgi:hypothetical protein
MRPLLYTGLLIALLAENTVLPAPRANAQTSTGIVVESVTDYGPGDQLPNAIPNGDGFVQGMVFPGSRFHLNSRWTNGTVYDTDFVDPQINSLGNDQNNFDKPGTAVSYFTGHGSCLDGCSTHRSCTTTRACTSPNASAGERLPGTCRFSPFDAPRCCYLTDRAAITHGTGDRFGGVVNYSRGATRFGESPQSGTWAGAGTDGGANLVVLDISCGILPPFWVDATLNSFAGMQFFATIMVAGGDTAIVADRGSTLAHFYRANENTPIVDSWLNTMASLPAGEGQPCPGGGGGHGFNGCGCNIIVAVDSTRERVFAGLNETWVSLTHDINDAIGNGWAEVRWHCNYALPSTTQSAWELP